MRILMLGWEFPPYISGGLGTACYGLTRALDKLGHKVLFVLPKAVDRSKASHIRLLSPDLPAIAANADGTGMQPGAVTGGTRTRLVSGGGRTVEYAEEEFEHARFIGVTGAGFAHPYPAFESRDQTSLAATDHRSGGLGRIAAGGGPDSHDDEGEAIIAAHQPTSPGGGSNGPAGSGHVGSGGGAGAAYEGDMIQNAKRYARLVVALARREQFDVIHAHDWMTYPAGLDIARRTGRPLVVHVHSTEFDRSGDNVNQAVYDIEKRGMHGATRIVAVSNLTKSICTDRYGVNPERVDVVWNGIDNDAAQPEHHSEGIASSDRIVLFLGRITMQKGPEYFIAAAKRVLEKEKNVKFVVAGNGDMAIRMIEYAASLGIGHKVTFTGFLRGSQVDQVFQMADLYVMPSVSEPFGIAPLEAIRNDTPVIISKQSGVSEVLTHALKVDFWDIDEMANKIVAVLRHPPLGQTLREHGAFELRRLTWEGAAAKCVASYHHAMQKSR